MASPINANAPTQALLDAVNPRKKEVAEGSVEADTNKFMTLLVTQLKNQDPMSPMENAELTNKLNATMETLKSSYQMSESLQAANMIGRGVLTTGNTLNLVESKAVLGLDLATPADNVTVSVLNASGKVVHTMNLGKQEAGTVPLVWDGETDGVDGATGPLAKDGKYSFQFEATRGGETLKDAKPLQYGSVASVSTSLKDGVKLNIPNVGLISMADVKQIL